MKTVNIRFNKSNYIGKGHFRITLPGSDDFSRYSVSVDNISFHNTFPNVSKELGNTKMILGPLNSEKEIELRQGNYSVRELSKYIAFLYSIKSGTTFDKDILESAAIYNRIRIDVPAGWVVKFDKGMANFLGAGDPTEGDTWIYRGLALEEQEYLLPKPPLIDTVKQVYVRTNIIADLYGNDILIAYTVKAGYPRLEDYSPPILQWFEVIGGKNLNHIDLYFEDQDHRVLDPEDSFTCSLLLRPTNSI